MTDNPRRWQRRLPPLTLRTGVGKGKVREALTTALAPLCPQGQRVVSKMAQIEGTSVSPWCLDLLGLRVVPHGQRADKVLGLQLGEFLLVVSAGCSSSQTWGPGHESEATWGPSARSLWEAEQAALAEKVSISGVRFGSMSWNPSPLWLKLYVAPYLVLSLLCLSTCDSWCQVCCGDLGSTRAVSRRHQGEN